MIKAITFDLDNTLVDFMGFKRAATNAAAQAMVKAGLDMKVEDCQEELFGYYLTDIEGNTVFGDFLRQHNQYSDKILAAAINAYLVSKQENLKPYAGVRTTITKLKEKGIYIAVLTDAPRLKAFQRLNAMGIDDLFDWVVGFEDTMHHKPSPLPYCKALSLMGVKPEEAMHVGDWAERDVKSAHAVGMLTCLALYGDGPGPYVQPDYEIGSFEEILELNVIQ